MNFSTPIVLVRFCLIEVLILKPSFLSIVCGVGFVIETLPLVGCGDEIPRQLTGLFQHSLPLGSNLQCLLIASSRTEPWIKTWETRRFNSSEILQQLAKERGTHLRTLSCGQGIRTFRLLISYSEPNHLLNLLQTFSL